MDESLLERLAFFESAYYVLYSTPVVTAQYIICICTLLWTVIYAVTVAQTPFHFSCKVILILNSVSCMLMVAAHGLRLFFIINQFENYVSWNAIWFLNYFHACVDGLYTVSLFLLLIERNFAILNPSVYKRYKRPYNIVVGVAFILVIGLSVALGVMMYTSYLLANISTGINNVLLLSTIGGCGYCLYVGKIQNKRRSYWTSLESKYRLAEGIELFRSIIPVCAASCLLKFIGMLPLWVGQFYFEFNIIAYAVYYLTNTLSVLICILILIFRNKELKKNFSQLLRIKSCEPKVKLNMDSSGETYFKQLEQHWK